MLAGVAEMTRVVAATYGPRGRTVMLDRAGGLISTKDGVSVAWEVEPDNRLQRLGTRLLQEACSKVNKSCGDGTTTTAILTHALLREGLKWVASGVHPAEFARHLQLLADDLDGANLWDVMQPVPVESEELMLQVALTASNGDQEIAEALVDAFGRVGSEGIIVVEEGKGRGIELDHKTGMEIDKGWESSDLAGPDGGPRHMDVPLVALVDAELTTMKDVATILEEATQFPHPLLIVSRGCFGEALQVLTANDRKLDRADGAKFEVVAVRCPGHVEDMRTHLDDLAALTGATIIDPAVTPLHKFKSEMLGSAQTATVKKESATFVAFEDKYPLIEARVEQLQKMDTGFSHDAEEIRTRIAKLTDGFCVMRVGGWSQAELREKRGRIEDALEALRVAIEEGVVPGAGSAYLALAAFFEQYTGGPASRALQDALREPLRTLARNAGKEAPVVLERVLEASRRPGETSWSVGWDARTDTIRDLTELPVICDPLAVVKATILTAISTASTLLTVEVALTRVDS
jgi:chaperonin GroEL